jgi:hypothetical protein
MVARRESGQGLNLLMGNRLPVGPGSRGGQWHEPEFRRAYWRKWRAEHPEYRDREKQRSLLNKGITRVVRAMREV